VYTIQYNYVNYGDGTCEPVEASARGYINVGLNPCAPPSPMFITSNPGIMDGDTIVLGESIGFLAAGGLSGDITWELIGQDGPLRNGSGNSFSHSFFQEGEYHVVFTSTNSSFPLGCTQTFGNSETLRLYVRANDIPTISFLPQSMPNDSTITVCTTIQDDDADDVHQATICNNFTNGNATAFVNDQGEVCVTYTPDPDFVGTAQICVEVCDDRGGCDQTTLIVDVLESNDPPEATDDYEKLDQEETVNIDVLDNDMDPNGDPLTVKIITQPTQGTASVMNDGRIFYDPINTYSGMDSIVYEICDDDNPAECDRAVVYIEVTTRFICLTIDTKVFLEGALVIPDGSDSYADMMRTDLNDLRILPGQAYSEGFFSAVQYTQSGQPFNLQPWWYNGDEGSLYDSNGDADNGDAGYPSTVVDWVLVSLRRDIDDEAGSVICQRAALLHNDGRVEIPGDECCLVDSTESFYLVIEHRNHLMVMTSTRIDIAGQSLTHDFTSQNSYRQGDINFGALVGNGQKEVNPGVYAMYGGNGEQRFAQNDTDITADDQLIWALGNGRIGDYLFSDFNMNGDVNFNDLILWSQNNGNFTTVPRDNNQ